MSDDELPQGDRMRHTERVAMDLAQLRRPRASILTAASRRGAHAVRVFGSVARGEYTPTSDVDLVVTFESNWALLDQVHLAASGPRDPQLHRKRQP